MHLGGRFLAQDMLELPSQLFELMLTHPLAVAAICRHQDTGAQLPEALAARLAGQYASHHYSPLALQDRVGRTAVRAFPGCCQRV